MTTTTKARKANKATKTAANRINVPKGGNAKLNKMAADIAASKAVKNAAKGDGIDAPAYSKEVKAAIASVYAIGNLAVKAVAAAEQAADARKAAIEAAKAAEEQTVSKAKAPVWAKAQEAAELIRKAHGKGAFSQTDFDDVYLSPLKDGYKATLSGVDAEQAEKRARIWAINFRTVILGFVNGLKVSEEVTGNVQKAAKELKPLLEEKGLKPEANSGAKAGVERADPRTSADTPKGQKQEAEKVKSELAKSISPADLIKGKVTSDMAAEFIAMVQLLAKDGKPAVYAMWMKSALADLAEATADIN